MSDPGDDLFRITRANRDAWNASAVHHGSGLEWQRLVDGFSGPGFSTFDETATACLNGIGIVGKSVVQVCCNNGRELLSLKSFGMARGLGIDQSDEFIAQAEALNAIAGANCGFLCSDIYALPPDVPRDFDLALVTIGAINWMPDLDRFFAVMAGLLKPGGQVMLYETHPYLEMFDPKSTDPHRPVFSYFQREPDVDTAGIVYDGSVVEAVSESYWYIHRMADVINGCIQAGLRIERLEEFPHSNRDADYDIYENQSAQLPMCFTLIARKEG